MPNRNTKLSDRLSAIETADEVVGLRAAVMDALALMGMSAAYFIAPLTADPRVGRILTNIGCSHIWERHYRSRLHLIDPLPRISLKRSGAFMWPDVFEGEKVSVKETRYLDIAAKFGLGRGIGVACYGPHGRSGFLGAVWSKAGEPDPMVSQWVNIVGSTSFGRYCQLIRSDDDIPPLSNRELEVLSWMCDGKSNSVIAQILEISSSSVDVYVRRIFAKLDVTDRTAACLRGFALGLVISNDYQRLMKQTVKDDPDGAID